MESIFNDIGQSLFSVAVAAFLLLRMEKRLAQLTEAISLLRHCQTCRISPWNVTIDAETREAVEE